MLAISSPGSDLDFIGKNQQVKTVSIEMSRKITPLLDINSIFRLFISFIKERPLIVHTHTPKAGFLGMAAASIADVPIKLHTVAGLPLMEAKGIKRFVLEKVELITYWFADRVYPNSNNLKQFILERNLCLEKKLKVIGYGSSNGINTAYFCPSAELSKKATHIRKYFGIAEEEIVFCFIGRIVKDKGIDELLIAFENISKVYRVKLLLIGNYEEELDPISEASKNIIKNNVNIINCGWQEDVRPYLAASDILVFPSYREGFPNVPMQAGAMGLPCIVTNINGCNEIIEDGKNGLIVEPKNAKQLEEAMLKLIEDEKLRRQLAGNAREMIKSRYEQQYVWNEILKEYKSLEHAYTRKTVYTILFKRFCDIIISFCILSLSLPLTVIASLLLLINNERKIFFIQSRPGKNEKLLNLIKFKTMNDRRNKNGELLPDEERLTFVGKIIRKTSIDELPQMINVLKGDMSLIGPRPLLVEYLPLYSEEHKRRHNVKPGITGWAQVNGRNSLTWKEKFDLDVWYVDNVSFWLDVKIFFLTIYKIFKSEGISQEGHVTMTKFTGNN
jgi:lipopolysaccharide/colanic/teichoic acid biosynthesis glycosyltransferase